MPAEDPLTLSAKDLHDDLVVNTGSVLVAAQQALAGFAQLPASVSKTFIYTGNFLNLEIMPLLLSAGMGKAATAHLMRVASKAYADKGSRCVPMQSVVLHRHADFRTAFTMPMSVWRAALLPFET